MWSAGGADQAVVEQPQAQSGGATRNRRSAMKVVTTAENSVGVQRRRLRRAADGEQVTPDSEDLSEERAA